MERKNIHLRQAPISIVSQEEQAFFGRGILLILFAVGIAFCLLGECSERNSSSTHHEIEGRFDSP
jgi:hypothetical protein